MYDTNLTFSWKKIHRKIVLLGDGVTERNLETNSTKTNRPVLAHWPN